MEKAVCFMIKYYLQVSEKFVNFVVWNLALFISLVLKKANLNYLKILLLKRYGYESRATMEPMFKCY